MSSTIAVMPFHPAPLDSAGVVSWVHIGDLHMTRVGEQNYLDLQAIVDKVNEVFAGAICFVYLPGDIADDGSKAAYGVVRELLDRLRVPWCAIVGDHDVHEKSFGNFLDSMAQETHYSFAVGKTRFLAMNAFDKPDPGSFAVLPEQLKWLEQELEAATVSGQNKVILLHCYPSELKMGGEHVQEFIRKYDVQLVAMGHTHYNEIANDGRTIYTATRSTGQIEEGPVGFSVTNLDGGIVSWRFFELGKLPAVMITSPSDEHLMTSSPQGGTIAEKTVQVRAKVWGDVEIRRVHASFGQQSVELRRVAQSQVWEGPIPTHHLAGGAYPLRVQIEDVNGKVAEDTVRVLMGDAEALTKEHSERGRPNTLAAWPEHGLLGTQLGPNKNGRKW